MQRQDEQKCSRAQFCGPSSGRASQHTAVKALMNPEGNLIPHTDQLREQQVDDSTKHLVQRQQAVDSLDESDLTTHRGRGAPCLRLSV